MTTPRTLEGSRWSCRGCGDCCRGFELGPVEPEVIAHLEDRGITELWPAAAEAPWYSERTGPDGQPAYFLAHRDEQCVFLEPDARCAVHRLLGEAAKPSFCRAYPLHVVPHPGGPTVAVRADCSGLHETFRDGRPVQEQLQEVLALPHPGPRRPFANRDVELLPGLAVSAENWLALEAPLLEELQGLEPLEAAARLRERLFALVDRPSPPARPEVYAAALEGLLTPLAAVFQSASEALPEGHRQALCAQAAGFARRAALGRPVSLTEEGRGYLDLVTRTELLAKRFTAVGGLPQGMGTVLLLAEVARRGVSPGELGTPHNLGPILARWRRALDLPFALDLLRRGQSALTALFLNAEPL